MQLVNELAEKYALQYTSNEDIYLKKVFEETIANHPKSHLQSDWVQGNFLSFLCNISQAKNVLEIGTFTGFSALCLAKGLTNNGLVHTIEIREEDAKKAAENFSNSAYKNKIHLHVGNALTIIPTIGLQWDLVFIDADKVGYIEYYEMVLPNLSSNGFIVADNVLFHGEVLESPLKGKNAKAIDAFNKHVINDNRTEQVMLTVRDGLMIIKKK